jgi:hypothetical protein
MKNRNRIRLIRPLPAGNRLNAAVNDRRHR